jgi:hypothetical protein
MVLERRGIPTATFITHAFSNYARGLCRMQAMPSLPLIVIPHPIASRPEDELKQKVRAVHGELRKALIRGE